MPSIPSSFQPIVLYHWDCCLDVAEWLVRPNDPESYAGGGVYIPGRARSRSRVQTKVSPMNLQMWRLGFGITTPSCNKILVTETATKTPNNLHADLPGKVWQGMTASSESRKETAWSWNWWVQKPRLGLVFGMYVLCMKLGSTLAQVTAEMRRYNLHVLGVGYSYPCHQEKMEMDRACAAEGQ